MYLPRPGRTAKPLGDAPHSLGCICNWKCCCWMSNNLCPSKSPWALSNAARVG